MNKKEFIEKHGEDKYHEVLGDFAGVIEMTKTMFDLPDSWTAVYFLRDTLNKKSEENDPDYGQDEYTPVSEALDIYEEHLMEYEKTNE